MKKIVLSCFVVFVLSLASYKNNNANAEQAVEQATAAVEQVAANVVVSSTYTTEPSSVIEWVGKKPTGQHTGTISLKSGSLTVDNGNITGDFTIDMNSITVTDITEADGKLDLEAHLKGTGKEDGADHFFNVKTYPTGTFKLTSFNRIRCAHPSPNEHEGGEASPARPAGRHGGPGLGNRWADRRNSGCPDCNGSPPS